MFGRIELGDAVPEAQKRKPWRVDQLNALFATPIWSGTRARYEDRRNRHEVGRWIHVDAYWWLPILAITTGARLEELAQLHHEDVRTSTDGIRFLHINDQGARQLKTKSSVRAIPLHPLLLELGFDRLVKPKGKGRIFTELTKHATHKKYGSDYSEDFTTYRKNTGLYEPLRDFHSFRHAFISALRGKGGVEPSLVAAMVGHGKDEDIELARFTITDGYTDYDVADRFNAISKLRYEDLGLKLDHVRFAASKVKDGRGSFRLPDELVDGFRATLVQAKGSIPKGFIDVD